MRRTLLLAAVIAALAACPAFAHAHLKGARPAPGSTVASAASITLDFSESVVPAYSGVALADASGKPVALGSATAGASAKSLVVPIAAPLAAGTYSVTWHAVSVDTHRTQGAFRFTVAP